MPSLGRQRQKISLFRFVKTLLLNIYQPYVQIHRMRVNPAVRTLTNMEEAEKSGLANMPAVEPCMAVLVVSPHEALRPNPCCPSAEYRGTDDLIVKAQNKATRVGQLSNSLTHLLLVIQTSLSGRGEEKTRGSLKYSIADNGLYGPRLMVGTLLHGRYQVWLAPYSRPCVRTSSERCPGPSCLIG